MALLFILILTISLVFIQSRTTIEKLSYSSENYTHLDIYANALSKSHYNPWTCNYRFEPGYKCLSCSAALHCYPGNFALLVQCSGLFPHCRNGYCSLWKTEGCNENYTFAEGTHGPFLVTTVSSKRTTIPTEEYLLNETTATDESLQTSNVTTELISEVGEIERPTDIPDSDKPYIEKDSRNN